MYIIFLNDKRPKFIPICLRNTDRHIFICTHPLCLAQTVFWYTLRWSETTVPERICMIYPDTTKNGLKLQEKYSASKITIGFHLDK